MNTKNLTINNSSKNEKVKNLATRLPDAGIAVLLLAFLIETVDLSDLTGLVVTTNESDLIWVPEIS